MNPRIEAIAKKVQEIVRQGSQVRAGADSPSGIVDVSRKYHAWYAACLAVVEANMPSRVSELARLNDKINLSEFSIRAFANAANVAVRAAAVALREILAQISGIVGSVPSYLEAKAYSLELQLATKLAEDLLSEAEVLIQAGYIRAAGAVAGVMLERHLKRLCDAQTPPIPYADKATISPLNELLKKAGVYDQVTWRQVQVLGDIRNECDHAKPSDPKVGQVRALLDELRKLISSYPA